MYGPTSQPTLPNNGTLPRLPSSQQPPYLPSPEPKFGAALAEQQHANAEVTLIPATQEIAYTQVSGDQCDALNGTLHNVTFYRGSARLTQNSTIALNNASETLRSCTHKKLTVSAHTDNSGSAVANIALSKQRARTVAMYLGSRGVDMNRIRAVAFGESRPVAPNSTLDGRMRNRRVEFKVQ